MSQSAADDGAAKRPITQGQQQPHATNCTALHRYVQTAGRMDWLAGRVRR
jgi:hypothetical protein